MAISNPDFREAEEKSSLSGDFVDSANQIDDRCGANRDSSQFVATGRGGLPENPQGALNPVQPWADLRLAPRSQTTAQISLEAQAWQPLGDGRIALLGESALNAPASCAVGR
ncbi:MAG: hypothetical protein HC860_07385 [Alkalinema sp. RU_4_3]|nr:hypothetical protein [Alkalinema sp. RU_4_3]